MPTLQQLYTLEITPEKFVDNCSNVELQELLLLANAKLSRNGAPPPPEKPEVLKALPKAPAVPDVPNASVAKNRRWASYEEAMLRELELSITIDELRQLCRALNVTFTAETFERQLRLFE